MIVGVVLAAQAGFGRERQQKKSSPASGSFAGGLMMMVISGLLVGCMNFAFVYSQDSILGNLSLIRPGDSIAVDDHRRRKRTRSTARYPVDADGPSLAAAGTLAA